MQVIKNRFDYSGFYLRDEEFIDSGYLLISRFSLENKQVVIELVQIDGFRVLHQWIPPIEQILQKGGRPEDLNNLSVSASEFRAQHPLLFEDGSIVISDGEGVLSRITRKGKVQWVLSDHFHHSLELDNDGNILATNYETGHFNDIHENMREEMILVISPGGQVLKKYPIVQILIDNGYFALLGGIGDLVNHEMVHLNDIHPISEDQGVARAGDYALSFQRISSVALFRPSENKIVSLKTGPWLKQHDIDPLGDGRYSIFNNNAWALHGVGYSMRTPHSSISLWEPSTGVVEEPYNEAFEKADIRTKTEGRCRLLPNGDAYVEETESNRLLRISKDDVRWEYVNSSAAHSNVSGALHWCRYYLPEEIDLGWLEETHE
ncbi:MAG: arylsulfotransferase family protein [Candidatus Sumerlaeota bacterium]